MKQAAGIQVRVSAARVLAAVIAEGRSLDRCLATAMADVNERDKPLLRELCFGTVRGFFRYDGLIQPLLKKPFKRKDTDVLALLFLGCHQLLAMRIADHAAVATVVECSRAIGKPWASGLINAVLRSVQRRHDELQARLPAAAAAGLPDWLYQMIQAEWPEDLKQIINAGNAHPPMYIRVNPANHTGVQYRELLLEHGLESMAVMQSSQALRLEAPVNVELLPGFEQGWVSVQDASAQLAAELLDPNADHRVLDACAAPGGKSCNLLECYPNINLTCLDNDPERLLLVEDNLARLSLSASILTGDASDPDSWWDGNQFDRILVDAPCTGTGVIRRHPDIKLLRQKQDIEKLSRLQSQILSRLWPLLSPGGVLLYATCSIMPVENSSVVERFLNTTPDARELEIESTWGRKQPVGRQILPNIDGGDGFFYARVTKALQSAG